MSIIGVGVLIRMSRQREKKGGCQLPMLATVEIEFAPEKGVAEAIRLFIFYFRCWTCIKCVGIVCSIENLYI